MISREKLNQRIQHLLSQQKTKGYKKGWVWYKISTEAEFKDMTLDDVQYIGQQLGYKKGWAWHEFQNLNANKNDKEPSKSNRQTQQTYTYTNTSTSKDWEDFLRRYHGFGSIEQELQLFGLKQPFDSRTLKIAYWEKAKSTHPDAGGSVSEFQVVQKAYELLKKHTSDFKAS